MEFLGILTASFASTLLTVVKRNLDLMVFIPEIIYLR